MSSVPFLSRHQPIITNRISFTKVKSTPLPTITGRIDFTGKWDNPSKFAPPGQIPPASVEILNLGLDPASGSEVGDGDRPEGDGIFTEPREDRRKIPKPQGEPGRPRSGGYTLSKVLKGWGDDLKIISVRVVVYFFKEESRLHSLEAYIKDEADKTLDTALCYKNQPQERITALCELAAKRYPILDKYQDNWPARDILKAHLKYTSMKQAPKHKQKPS